MVFCFAGNQKYVCGATKSMQDYSQHMGNLDVWHRGMIEVDLYQNLKFSPADLLNLKGRFGDLCRYY